MKASMAIILVTLAFYLSFVLTITIIERVPRKNARYNLELFWSYKAIVAGKVQLFAEIFWNIVLFVPIGLMVSALLEKNIWLSVMIGALLSAGIEITQLLTHRGLFEWDDIIHNTFGALVGLLLYLFLKKWERRKK